jgi:hypothetical protein
VVEIIEFFELNNEHFESRDAKLCDGTGFEKDSGNVALLDILLHHVVLNLEDNFTCGKRVFLYAQ